MPLSLQYGPARGRKNGARRLENSIKIEKSVDRRPLFRVYFYVAGLSFSMTAFSCA